MSLVYNKLTNDFKQLIKNNKLSHAYLFFGGDEKEKFVLARSLANFLENGVFEHQDKLLRETLIIPPDEKGIIGIDCVRSLKYFLWQKSVNSARRIVIVKDSWNLTFEAQNAVLKIVEEPPESALIIFIAKTIDDLLPVLNSRLQKIYFSNQNQIGANETQINSVRNYISNEVNAGIQPPYLRANQRKPALNEDEIDYFFKNLIYNLRKNPIENSYKLKEALKRLTLIKQFNLNKRLQIKALLWKKEEI